MKLDNPRQLATEMVRSARTLIGFAVALKSLLVATAFIPPAIVGVIVDEVLVARNGERLYLLLGVFVGVFAVETMLKMAETWVTNRAVHSVVARQRMRVFRSVQRLTWTDVARRAPGELLRRIEEDTEEIGSFLVQRIERIFHWGLVVVGTVLCVVVSWRLSVAGVVLTVAIWLLGRWFKVKAEVRGRAFREGVGKWSAWLHESLLGWREVRMLNLKGVQDAKMVTWLKTIDRLRGANFTFKFLQTELGRVQETFVSQATFYFLGAVLIFVGSLTLGALIAFMRYFARVLDSVDHVNRLNVLLGNTLASLAKSFEVDGWAQIGPRLRRQNEPQGWDIECREVFYAYDDGQSVLRGVNCAISGGGRVAIVGASGCGKSTLARIIAGQLSPISGDVRIGGRLVPESNSEGLGSVIVVGQDSVLYNMSIRENLLLARPRSREAELVRACSDAQILSLIDRLPDGLDTVIGERGRQLSAGERQRLILARTMLIERKVLILDEATSQLDDPTARLIHQKVLDEQIKRTVIIIAHRISTAMGVSRTFVLEDGRVSGEGTHEQLMNTSEAYRRLLGRDERADSGEGFAPIRGMVAPRSGKYQDQSYAENVAKEENITETNRRRWDVLSEARVMFSRPWLDLSIDDATAILIAAHIDVNEVDMRELDVLCLAAGGGQQSAVFGVLGSRAVVLDFSKRQLERDQEAAHHYGYEIRTELGDMRDLSQFSANTFDIVWHAWSINFVPDPLRSFREVVRTLRRGGWYVLEFANPAAVNVDRDSWDGRGYLVRMPFRDGAERESVRKWTWSDGKRIVRRAAPREWMHSLGYIIGQLSALGMSIVSCEEYPTGDLNARPGSMDHSFAYSPPSLRITAILSTDTEIRATSTIHRLPGDSRR